MPDPIRGVNTPNPVTPAASTGQTGSAQSTDATDAANAATPAAASPAPILPMSAQTEALLQTIIQAASNTPGIDQAKVAELQQAIASGAYQANPQSLPRKSSSWKPCSALRGRFDEALALFQEASRRAAKMGSAAACSASRLIHSCTRASRSAA